MDIGERLTGGREAKISVGGFGVGVYVYVKNRKEERERKRKRERNEKRGEVHVEWRGRTVDGWQWINEGGPKER